MSQQQKIIASPGRAVAGTVRVPGDKSISHRALMLGALAEGRTHISGFLAGEDCLATMTAMRALGAQIDATNLDSIVVDGLGLQGLTPAGHALDMGNSGTGLRLLAGLLAGQPFATVLTGDESLRRRPMERVAVPLRQMGATVTTVAGCPPIEIHGGKLRPIDYRTPVASAQVKSAILLAGMYAEGETRVTEPGITRDHTERMLESFGAQISYGDQVAVISGPAKLSACDIRVPGDLSSAAFVLGAGCLAEGSEVVVEGVGINPTRTGVIDILMLMGADIELRDRAMTGAEPIANLVVRPSRLQGVTVPTELIPLAIDELPLIFALAAASEGVTRITGAAELRHKESDRIAAMAAGLRELGVRVDELQDGAVIYGGRVQGGTVNSHGDHRIAMAFSVLAMVAEGAVSVLDTANVATSFPGFIELMAGLGMEVALG